MKAMEAMEEGNGGSGGEGNGGNGEGGNGGNEGNGNEDNGTFYVPGAGDLTCIKISGSSETLEDGSIFWTMTYEGTSLESVDPSTQITYTFDKSLEANGLVHLTLTMNAIKTGDTPPSVETPSGGDPSSGNNSENEPPFNIQLKDPLEIEGIGTGLCTKISGGKEFDEYGLPRWNMSYEFVFVQLQEDHDEEGYANYTFDVTRDDNGLIYKTGTMEIVQVLDGDDEPTFNPPKVSETITVPGVGDLVCTKVSGGHEMYIGQRRVWTITYEGVAIDVENSDANTEVKFSFNKSKEDDGRIHITGSIEIRNIGETPTVDPDFGEKIEEIPGMALDVTRVNCNRETKLEDGKYLWIVTIEGETWDDSDEEPPKDKYTFSKSKDGDEFDIRVTRETIQDLKNPGDEPNFSFQNITIGRDEYECTGVSASNEWLENGVERWTITYESTTTKDDESQNKAKYTIERYRGDNNLRFVKVTEERQYKENASSSNEGNEGGEGGGSGSGSGSGGEGGGEQNEMHVPLTSAVVGGAFTPPFRLPKSDDSGSGNGGSGGEGEGVSLTCTRVSLSDEYDDKGNHIWNITTEAIGVEIEDTNLPDDETNMTEELNGLTTRAVDGTFVVLQRCETPIIKRTITKYENLVSVNPNNSGSGNSGSGGGSGLNSYKPGTDGPDGGTIILHRVSKVEIREGGILIATYDRHDIEVEE